MKPTYKVGAGGAAAAGGGGTGGTGTNFSRGNNAVAAAAIDEETDDGNADMPAPHMQVLYLLSLLLEGVESIRL